MMINRQHYQSLLHSAKNNLCALKTIHTKCELISLTNWIFCFQWCHITDIPGSSTAKNVIILVALSTTMKLKHTNLKWRYDHFRFWTGAHVYHIKKGDKDVLQICATFWRQMQSKCDYSLLMLCILKVCERFCIIEVAGLYQLQYCAFVTKQCPAGNLNITFSCIQRPTVGQIYTCLSISTKFGIVLTYFLNESRNNQDLVVWLWWKPCFLWLWCFDSGINMLLLLILLWMFFVHQRWVWHPHKLKKKTGCSSRYQVSHWPIIIFEHWSVL